MAKQSCPTPLKLFANKHWQNCYERFLQSKYARCNSAECVNTYQAILHCFILSLPPLPSGKPRPPDGVTQQHVEDYLHTPSKRSGQPVSPCTHNNRLGTIQSFYSYASTFRVPFRNGYRPLFRGVSPTSGISQQRTRQVDRTLSDEEFKRLLATIPRDTIRGSRDRALVLFYFWTCRRRAEIISLRRRDLELVTLDNGVKGWIYRFRGKGRSAVDDHDNLPPRAKQALDEYLALDGRSLDTMDPDEPLFRSVYWRANHTPMNPKSVNTMLREYWTAAGLHGSPHWFRHTGAFVHWQETDKDLVRVSRLLRHSSIEFTRVYLEAAQKESPTEISRIESRFGDM